MPIGTNRCPTIHLKTNVIIVAPIAPFSCGVCFEESWCDGADRAELEQNRIFCEHGVVPSGIIQ